MQRVLIILLIICGVAAGLWLFARKAADKNAPLPPAPPPPPPQTGGASSQAGPGGLFSTDQGPGADAVRQRMSEIATKTSRVADDIAPGLDITRRIVQGVQYLPDFLLANISTSTGRVGATGIPLILSAQNRQAVKALSEIQYLKAANYWPSLEIIVNAASEIKNALGVRILEDNMYNKKDLNPIRNEMVIRFTGIDFDYKNDNVKKGVERAILDINQFGKNWLSLAAQADAALKDEAVKDLRASGWKFIGYDSPT